MTTIAKTTEDCHNNSHNHATEMFTHGRHTQRAGGLPVAATNPIPVRATYGTPLRRYPYSLLSQHNKLLVHTPGCGCLSCYLDYNSSTRSSLAGSAEEEAEVAAITSSYKNVPLDYYSKANAVATPPAAQKRDLHSPVPVQQALSSRMCSRVQTWEEHAWHQLQPRESPTASRECTPQRHRIDPGAGKTPSDASSSSSSASSPSTPPIARMNSTSEKQLALPRDYFAAVLAAAEESDAAMHRKCSEHTHGGGSSNSNSSSNSSSCYKLSPIPSSENADGSCSSDSSEMILISRSDTRSLEERVQDHENMKLMARIGFKVPGCYLKCPTGSCQHSQSNSPTSIAGMMFVGVHNSSPPSARNILSGGCLTPYQLMPSVLSGRSPAMRQSGAIGVDQEAPEPETTCLFAKQVCDSPCLSSSAESFDDDDDDDDEINDSGKEKENLPTPESTAAETYRRHEQVFLELKNTLEQAWLYPACSSHATPAACMPTPHQSRRHGSLIVDNRQFFLRTALINQARSKGNSSAVPTVSATAPSSARAAIATDHGGNKINNALISATSSVAAALIASERYSQQSNYHHQRGRSCSGPLSVVITAN